MLVKGIGGSAVRLVQEKRDKVELGFDCHDTESYFWCDDARSRPGSSVEPDI